MALRTLGLLKCGALPTIKTTRVNNDVRWPLEVCV